MLLLYCILIFFLSNQPSLPTPNGFEGQDKLIHATAYAVMAWLCWQTGLHHYTTRPAVLAACSIIFCSLYGISDEYHQSFVAGRDSSLFDWLADTAGAALLILFRWQRWSKVTRNIDIE